MDLFCPTCGEPWEFDSLHDEAQVRYGIPYYEEPDERGYYYGSPGFVKIQNPEYSSEEYQKIFTKVSAEFRAIGCKALKSFGPHEHCTKANADPEVDRVFGLDRASAASALYDVLGDDLDGAASMLEDMGF